MSKLQKLLKTEMLSSRIILKTHSGFKSLSDLHKHTYTLSINQLKALIMVLIEVEKLEEIIRKAIKEEMVAILTGTGKAMNFTINVTVKKDAEAIPPTRESNLAKTEVVLPDKEIIQKKQDANYPPAPRLLNSLKELAEFLQISKPTALKLKNSGCFPYKKLGNKLIFNSEEVLKGVTVEKHGLNQ